MRTIPIKESLTIEFKSDKKKYSDADLVDEIVGMTNTKGGTLYLGVEDNGEVTGVHSKHKDAIGVTALIFAAKGNVWSQILMTIFCILYAVISWRFCYWGEMITYLGMSLPMSVWSIITWAKNSSESGNSVAIQKLTLKHIAGLIMFGILITLIFYFILRALNTPNIVFSTISITTSFLASALTLLRSSYYALGYASNDIVLIVLWILASFKNPVYLPVAFNFMIFLINDLYGFISWKKRETMAS